MAKQDKKSKERLTQMDPEDLLDLFEQSFSSEQEFPRKQLKKEILNRLTTHQGVIQLMTDMFAVELE